MMISKRALADRLRAMRKARGLTQASVARELGLHRPSISEIEAGRRSVGVEELQRYSEMFGVMVADLLSEDAGDHADSEADRPEASSQATATAWRQDMEAVLERIVEIIVDRFAPERIILFGSHARGTADPGSDVDLLVVLDFEGPRRRKAVEIGVALHEVPVPKDVVVVTPEELAWRQKVPGTLERPAVREGRMLYARP